MATTRPARVFTASVFASAVCVSVVALGSSGDTAGATPTNKPKPTRTQRELPPISCEVAAEVHLGDKATIQCSGFTPNGSVAVVFHRPDGTLSDHVGGADAGGNFSGTFTVDPGRPAGSWELVLTDASTGRQTTIPFSVAAPPADPPEEPAAVPPPPPPREEPSPSPDLSLLVTVAGWLPWWLWVLFAFAIFGLSVAAFLFLLSLRRSRPGQTLPPASPPPPPAPPPKDNEFGETSHDDDSADSHVARDRK